MIIALIPARSGSKRVPGKNIRELAGHPLLAYTIQVAKDSGLFGEHIYVTSDSQEYLDIAKGYGAIPIKEIPCDRGSDKAWIKQANSTLPCLDEFLMLRPTNPFRVGETVKRAFNCYVANDRRNLKSVEPVRQHPDKMWVMDGLSMSPTKPNLHLLPAWALRSIYIQNASIEIRRAYDCPGGEAFLWECAGVYTPFITQNYEGFDINTEDDWILAEALIERGLVTLPEIK